MVHASSSAIAPVPESRHFRAAKLGTEVITIVDKTGKMENFMANVCQ
jgi:hypothetical protein